MEKDVTIERLDRCVANKDWIETFPMGKVLHGDLWCSDHHLLILVIDGVIPGLLQGPRRGDRHFHFEEAWCEEQE